MKTNTKKTMAALLMSFAVLSIMSVISAEEMLGTNSLKNALSGVDLEDSDAVHEAVKNYLPASYEETETSITDTGDNFILWTNDGKNVLWGKYRNNKFVGLDSNGMKAWGIYYKGFFAGFYGEKFFHGRYRGHNWAAFGLFGQERNFGKYVTFPMNRNFDRTLVLDKADAVALKERPLRQNLLRAAN